jgi:AmiR/NasT family two-component response regulator
MATGVMMERDGIDEDTAFTALLRLSLHHGESLRRLAEATVLSTIRTEPVLASDANG